MALIESCPIKLNKSNLHFFPFKFNQVLYNNGRTLKFYFLIISSFFSGRRNTTTQTGSAVRQRFEWDSPKWQGGSGDCLSRRPPQQSLTYSRFRSSCNHFLLAFIQINAKFKRGIWLERREMLLFVSTHPSTHI